ncbi:non-ribosomal peptide synthetase [Kitasatospora griseola]|uniref:non-ribosomal peptide synthetase n=1 Tax=Kitasatospora griseola TaxID=2064 RepID=UPI00381016CF
MTNRGRASFTQERFFFLDELQPGNPAYVVAFALRMEGLLDREELADAIRRVAVKHAILRTRLVMRDGDLQQEARDDVLPDIESTERAPVGLEAQDAYLRDLVASEARRPFSLGTGAVLRARIVSWTADTHALVVLVHHVACDGWGVGLLLDAIAEEYNTGTSRTPGITYLEYAEAQREAWAHNSSGVAHWREMLDGAPRLSLATDHRRPDVLTFRGAALRRPVDPAVVRRLTEWAKERGVTLFAVALAAYAQVLGRHAGQREVVIGVPVANRVEEAEEQLLGCLVNTLPVRVDLSGHPTFADLVTRTWRTALTAFSHQDVPFEQIVQASGEQRHLSHSPIYQTMLTVQNFTFTVPEFAGMKVNEVDIQIDAAKFDVGVTLDVSTRSPYLRADFSTELFDEATIAGLLTHFQTLLESVVSGTEPEPEMVSPEERALVVDRWNPRADAVGDLPSVLHSFLGHAAQAPDAVALAHRGETLSYAELDAWSNGIAAALAGAGAGRGDRVGLLLGRSAAVAASILGVWKVGCAYVPLDAEWPRHRLDGILDSARPAVVITEADGVAQAAQLSSDARGFARIDVREVDRAASVRAAAPDPDETACVVFTSDATGLHGVPVRHRALSALCGPGLLGAEVDVSDRWLGAHDLSTDLATWELCGALASGGRLVLAEDADLADPDRLARLVRDERITVLNRTPGTLRRLLPALLDTKPGDGPVAVRHVVVSGAEALDWSELASLVDPERLPAVFVGLHAVTEGGIYVTGHRVRAADLHTVRAGDLGVPLAHVRCYVLDDRGLPVGVNVAGELHVGGTSVPSGYVGADGPADGLADGRFGRDPYGPATLYRTGDLVRWSHDGRLMRVTREDGPATARLGGHRVDLAEIEAAFLRLPGVDGCAAAADGDEAVVFVCGDPGTGPDAGAELPAYMAPSRVVVVPEIPRDAAGRADTRRLLADLAAESAESTDAAQEPADAPSEPAASGQLVEQIRQIWADVLKQPDLEPTDNFFDAGGHSLALIVAQRRMAAVGLKTSITELFRCGTAAACAAHFEQAAVPVADDKAEQRRSGRDSLARRRQLERGGNHG